MNQLHTSSPSLLLYLKSESIGKLEPDLLLNKYTAHFFPIRYWVSRLQL